MRHLSLLLLAVSLAPFPGAAAQPALPDLAPFHRDLARRIAAEYPLEISQHREFLRTHPPRRLPRVRDLPDGPTRPTHIIFVFVDHWEPGTGPQSTDLARLWLEQYGAMAARHRDADGRMPQHTWFCAFLEREPLQIISRAVYRGLGEMEVHIHHGSSNDEWTDNTAEMDALLDRYLDALGRVGACRSVEPSPRRLFGFIHGMWALDNSRLLGVPQYCGVNRELDLLLSKGCYGDFTFPAWGPMEPVLQSTLFASRDDDAPKSYDREENIQRLEKGGPPAAADALLLFEGPGLVSANIDAEEGPTLDRMIGWVAQRVHVPGRPDWVFVKVHTHSAQNLANPAGQDRLIGGEMDRFLSDIEFVFNDGINYQLHYATAREAANLALAAADGQEGPPGRYRDYRIPPPANRRFACDTLYRLDSCLPGWKTEISLCETPESFVLRSADLPSSGTILEGPGRDGPLIPSDGVLRAASDTLVFEDFTPSAFYRFDATPPARAAAWENLP